MSYTELDERSGKLATLLQDQGVRPGVWWACARNRSPVCRAGDASRPPNAVPPMFRWISVSPWSEFEIYRDACPRLVVADTDLVGALSDDVGLAYLDEAWLIDRLDQDVIEPLSGVRVDPDQLASCHVYVRLHGQTQRVRITHRSIARLVLNTDYADFGPDHVGLLLAPLAFGCKHVRDMGTVVERWDTGHCAARSAGFDQIGQQIADHRVDTLWLTAGLFQGMVEESLPALSSLRQLQHRWRCSAQTSGAEVSECVSGDPSYQWVWATEGTTFTVVTPYRQRTLRGRAFPIGRRIANTRIYVLDRYMTPVPPGVIGELFIGGDGVAHGYMNDQVLTAASFMQDPFSSQTDARLYRTGDLGEISG